MVRFVSMLAAVLLSLTASVGGLPSGGDPIASLGPGDSVGFDTHFHNLSGLDGVIIEVHPNCRFMVTAVGFLETGAERESLAVVRDDSPFVVARSRVDGIIGWSTDDNLLAYIISTEDKQLLCLYSPTGRALDFNDLPAEAVGRLRGGGWTVSGEVILLSEKGLFTRSGMGEWTFTAFPKGFTLIDRPGFGSSFIDGCGTEVLGVADGRLAVWDTVTGAVRRGPGAHGVDNAGLTTRGNHVWVTRTGGSTYLQVYDVQWEHLGRADDLATAAAASSKHGWDLYYLTQRRGRIGIARWDLAHNQRHDLGLLPSGPKASGIAVSSDDRRLLILVEEVGTLLEVPLRAADQ